MKKIFKIIRFAIIGFVWTYVFLFAANYAMYELWSFNFLSAHSWNTISNFWNAGGIINSKQDYLFLLMLFSIPIVWIVGWFLLLKVNYFELLIYPIIAYNRHIINKYGHDSSRVVLRNLKSSQKMIEEIKEQLESIKPAQAQEVGNIRSEVLKKIGEINKKG